MAATLGGACSRDGSRGAANGPINDPDDFVRAKGAAAMERLLADAPSLAAHLWVEAFFGELTPPIAPAKKAGVADLMRIAARSILLARSTVDMQRGEATTERVDIERAVIAACSRNELGSTPILIGLDVWGTPGRALAWLCADRSRRIMGAKSSFFFALRSLYSRPFVSPKDLDIHRYLTTEAETELYEAERAPRMIQPLRALVADVRRVETLAALVPVLTALDQGMGLVDTSALLRVAADLFDGKGGPHEDRH